VAAAVIGVSAMQFRDDTAQPITGFTVADQSADFEWQGRLRAGQSIEIKGINGPIEAMRARGGDVSVSAVKRAGEKGDPNDVTFEVVEHDAGVTICAMYPSKDGRPNECAPEGRGRMNVKDNDTKVSFTVQVPDGVNLVAGTVNGDVEASEIGGDVHVHTVNGDVEASASGHVRASTVNGSIEASMGRADWTGDLSLTTVNGGISVYLPDDVGARVSASTVNGGMETDFPLTVQGRFGPRRLEGVIGGGGRDLTLSTVNGSIRLHRGT
jgi:DUF4097 and DUF4098 domain-containing protein YvlB